MDDSSARANIALFAKFVAASMRREAELIKAKPRSAKGSAGRRLPTP